MHVTPKRCAMSLLLIVLVVLCSYRAAEPCQARLLQRGMRGSDVAQLQELLVELGYELAIDGVFGKQTEAVIKQIQSTVELGIDGIVGSETTTMLEHLRERIFSYTVKQGDNLTALANRYDTTVKNISYYNALPNPDRLLPGQVLYIPTDSQVALAGALRSKIRMQWPVQGRISSGYGYRIHPVLNTRHFHGGIDIAAQQGMPVKAAAAGTVIKVGNLDNYGLAVVIEHGGGVTTWYGHNSQVTVGKGEIVKQGQTVALVGCSGMATGPHLDFRIKIGDQTVDPLEWLP